MKNIFLDISMYNKSLLNLRYIHTEFFDILRLMAEQEYATGIPFAYIFNMQNIRINYSLSTNLINFKINNFDKQISLESTLVKNDVRNIFLEYLKDKYKLEISLSLTISNEAFVKQLSKFIQTTNLEELITQ